ncbi:helix-turn-helix transcriptional regulator [Flavobacterium sp.]|uniref:helix-turn-helix domain-containing protein n=1 Tax=Flavobacterium sp. TaxID=239 RepID=UPI001B694F78|nr:helix-turn-helix transcriptional regulator [Flavobacterium sp.]MBP6128533.1 helix-turn-helix transcriptional regulator [Flavobacterium sp.]
MINTDHFVKRLETIFEYYGLTASLFADKINVQRSSISHLLSGRNKPSLDFILKVIENFPEVELLWLLNGKGSFPKGEMGSNEKLTVSSEEKTGQEEEKTEQEIDLFSQKTTLFETLPEKKSNTPKIETEVKPMHSESKIERIVVFYNDGTFKNYTP